jgi:hypothetical protein
MMQADGRGVGICLGTSGAVIAVVRSDPPRLVALGSVSWPYGLWQQSGPESGPAAVARRMLLRARRQLHLPRWCPVSVVIGPSLSDHTPDDVLAGSAGLLARAGLSQAWATAVDRAEALRREVTVATGALAAAATAEEASIAIGAALASLSPAAAPATIPGGVPAAEPVSAMASAPVPALTDRYAGWALQRIDDVEEPAMTAHGEW